MDKRQLTRIERELAKYQPEEGADQARVDQLLKNLHKIYGDGDQSADPITADDFQTIVDQLMEKYNMKQVKPTSE